jgi:hypothetical protein
MGGNKSEKNLYCPFNVNHKPVLILTRPRPRENEENIEEEHSRVSKDEGRQLKVSFSEIRILYIFQKFCKMFFSQIVMLSACYTKSMRKPFCANFHKEMCGYYGDGG